MSRSLTASVVNGSVEIALALSPACSRQRRGEQRTSPGCTRDLTLGNLRLMALFASVALVLPSCAPAVSGNPSSEARTASGPLYDEVQTLSQETMEELRRLGAGTVVFLMTVNEEGQVRPFKAPGRTVRTFEPGETIDDYGEISTYEGFAGGGVEILDVQPQIILLGQGSSLRYYRCRYPGGTKICYEYQ